MMKVMDGNQAAAYISYFFSELAAIYPITPSSSMAERVEAWSTSEKRNVFDEPLKVARSNSESTSVSIIHGALKMGILATTYTSSQGLLLMLPTMYRIAGQLLPTVFHVASRSITTNGQSIFGDHSDVMAARQTGFAILAAGSVQEVMDFAAVAHLTTIASSIPFLHFFDGFQTSHQLQTIHELTPADLKELIDYEALNHFRRRGLTPTNPRITGVNQNPDLHFQQREAINAYYNATLEITHRYMMKINAIRKTDYDLVNYYGDSEAERIIISMGAVGATIETTVDYLRKQGERVGFLNIRLYRPFPIELLRAKIPKKANRIAVMDRTKEPGSNGEPLLLDVQHALANDPRQLLIIGGRYGLGGKNVTPTDIATVFNHLKLPENKIKSEFTIGICDDVTHLSLPRQLESILISSSADYTAKFFGIGGDGTVSQTKSLAQSIFAQTGNYTQAMFEYTSHKSGGRTISHLRFSRMPIKKNHLPEQADFISISCHSYIQQYELIDDVRAEGIFLLNTEQNDEELRSYLPKSYIENILHKQIHFYAINVNEETSSMIATTFLALTQLSKDMVSTTIRKINVTTDWLAEENVRNNQQGNTPTSKSKIQQLLYKDKGDEISVGDLMKAGLVDDTLPTRDEKLEQYIINSPLSKRRSLEMYMPEWNAEACTMCNRCAFVCGQAALRPFLADDGEINEAPHTYMTKKFRNKDGYSYRIQVAPHGCTGCGLCVAECPKKNRALTMKPISMETTEENNWQFAQTLTTKQTNFPRETVFGSQLQKPLLEFSNACAGCGETIYVKILTQLFGERLIIANATGCSSIWGASQPYTPYTTNDQGQGPAWATSLLENNAEFGAGMQLATQMRRVKIAHKIESALKLPNLNLQLKNCLENWLIEIDKSQHTLKRAAALITALESSHQQIPILTEIYQLREHFAKPSHWLVGGDGWAYDIGFSGIDQALTSGADVNILVLDNEIYANTGGQATRATQAATITKFTSRGNLVAKKDIGAYAIILGNVYVAQVSYSMSPRLLLKILTEAENFPGPSLIIAYTPCIKHGINGGMIKSAQNAYEAVECGYWATYHYNPLVEACMEIDYKKPNFENLENYLRTQKRFSNLEQKNPELMIQLLNSCKQDAKKRFAFLEMIASNNRKNLN